MSACIIGMGIIAFMLVGLLGPLMLAVGYRDMRSAYPGVKRSFILYAIAVEGLALFLLEFTVEAASNIAGNVSSPFPPRAPGWLILANDVVLVGSVCSVLFGLLLDPRIRRGSDKPDH